MSQAEFSSLSRHCGSLSIPPRALCWCPDAIYTLMVVPSYGGDVQDGPATEGSAKKCQFRPLEPEIVVSNAHHLL